MPVQTTTPDDLHALFAALGLQKGTSVLMHSALFSLGRIEGGIAGFHSALRDVVGAEATIVVPTFTYSFRRGETFDIRNTPAPATLGIYSEFLRKSDEAVRSACPLFSFAAQGPEAEQFMAHRTVACFGDKSTYAALFAANLRIVAIGITYSTGISGFMHIEKLANIPYRKDLRLTGRTIGMDGHEYDDEAIHFARDEKRFPTGRTDREAVGQALETAGISTARSFGSGRHVAFDAVPFSEFVLAQLSKNPNLMFKSNAEENPHGT
jgi:aminoglycoside 3-N-acetyltransferase